MVITLDHSSGALTQYKKKDPNILISSITIRDAIEDDKIKLYYIDETRNSADILTKNLGQVLFYQFCPLLGLEVL